MASESFDRTDTTCKATLLQGVTDDAQRSADKRPLYYRCPLQNPSVPRPHGASFSASSHSDNLVPSYIDLLYDFSIPYSCDRSTSLSWF